jgi:hypothetical protein
VGPVSAVAGFQAEIIEAEADDERFGIVPDDVLDAEVSSKAVRIFAALTLYIDTDYVARVPRLVLASSLHMSVNSLDRALAELQGIGAVEVLHQQTVHGGLAASAYRLCLPAPPPPEFTAKPPLHCMDCGTTDDLTGDHIIPVVLGGVATADNIAVRCRPCNSRKGACREGGAGS